MRHIGALAVIGGLILATAAPAAGIGTLPEPGHDEETAGGEAIEILGIVTFVLVASAVATALMRRRSPRTLLRLHRVLGAAALVSGAIHGLLVLTSH